MESPAQGAVTKIIRSGYGDQASSLPFAAWVSGCAAIVGKWNLPSTTITASASTTRTASTADTASGPSDDGTGVGVDGGADGGVVALHRVAEALCAAQVTAHAAEHDLPARADRPIR